MKNFIVLLVFLIGFGCSTPSTNYDLIVSDVNLIDGTGNPMQKGVNVYVKDGRV